MGGEDTVRGSYSANPAVVRRRAEKMDIQRLGLIDVTGPEEAKVIVLPGGAVRNAGEADFDGTVIQQFIAHPTLQSPIRRGRLMQFRCVLIDRPKLHRRK